jgi:hypothetical protein
MEGIREPVKNSLPTIIKSEDKKSRMTPSFYLRWMLMLFNKTENQAKAFFPRAKKGARGQ